MKNLKLELFNYKKSLNIEQDEVCSIIEGHLNYFTEHDEKRVILSLNEKLKPYTYDKSVKSFLESINLELSQNSLVYDLKTLYRILNEKNQGELYRQPINVLLQTINLDNDQDRLVKVLNELSVYDWVPEIKFFVGNLTASPEKRNNLFNAGNSEPLYTVVESVENGHLAFIKDSWFLLTENNIEKTLLESHVKDENRLRTLRSLQTSMSYCNITESRIDFRISEYLTVGIGTNKDSIFINEDKLNAETTLESIFSSPVIPIINRNFYPLILEVSKNLDSFIELDVVKKVTNDLNPTLECYAFNYKNSIYLYRCDERYGYSLFQYSSAIELIDDIKREMQYDLTYFYESKLNKETVVRKKLEDKEREVSLKLEDINFNIDKLNGTIKLIGESETLTTALKNLKKRKSNLETELLGIKELKTNNKSNI